MNHTAAALAALSFLVLAAGPVFAGAWLQEEGTAYVRTSAGYLGTRERFDENGNRADWDPSEFRDSKYEEIEFGLYAEVGVRPGWNIVGYSGWKHVQGHLPSSVSTTYGLADFNLGIKRSLWNWGRTVTSVMATLTVPTGYEQTDFPALGSGVTDASFLALIGSSGAGLWGTGEVEYRVRGGNFRDQVRGAVGGGVNPTSRLGLRAEARGGVAVGSKKEPGRDIGFDPRKADADNLDLAVTVSYLVVGGIALEAEARHAAAGRNTLAGTKWSLALATTPAWRWKR